MVGPTGENRVLQSVFPEDKRTEVDGRKK